MWADIVLGGSGRVLELAELVGSPVVYTCRRARLFWFMGSVRDIMVDGACRVAVGLVGMADDPGGAWSGVISWTDDWGTMGVGAEY